MKKLILVAVALTAFIATAQAPLENKQMQINAGIGFSSWSTPVYVGLDYGVGNNITVGAEASYQSYKQSYFSDSYSSTIIGLQANGNYHFNEVLDIPSKFDLYAGLSLNYYIWSFDSKYKDVVANSSGIGFGGQLGGRYFFSDNWGVNLEFGGGSSVSGGKLGVTYKF